ncbi:LppP/LprE family lipoprotein [Kribbella sp.]|uniref:LppP/LprE family lipoprotein n=1 Tax=Kribbella sp. TaxID=1871183 RepID=UPI002D3DDEF9|nr:LppP/LprE family lipoprotein [Kribbella sp.]HZX05750.1 LppP/LprE family lipoprotein [Kribbella sp.]
MMAGARKLMGTVAVVAVGTLVGCSGGGSGAAGTPAPASSSTTSAAAASTSPSASPSSAGWAPTDPAGLPTDSPTPTQPAQPTQPAKSTPPVQASVSGVPDASGIKTAMAQTVEVKQPSVHFLPSSVKATVPDGNGGKLTAVVGTRSNAADGGGQVVFFFHGTKFVGWDGDTETSGVTSLAGAGQGVFTIKYTHFAKDDPACCPSLSPVTIHWSWQDNDGFAPSGGTRPYVGTPVAIRLKS